jgi:hypothetical protein
MSAWINYHAVWKIIVFGLLVGAGLPALFAVGVRLNAKEQASQVTPLSRTATPSSVPSAR